MQQIPIETSPTTDELILAIKAGKIKKSPDRKALVDDNGKVVATRLTSKGEYDYYADARQKFPKEGGGVERQVCVSFSHPSISICICVGWGDQMLE